MVEVMFPLFSDLGNRRRQRGAGRVLAKGGRVEVRGSVGGGRRLAGTLMGGRLLVFRRAGRISDG